MTVATGHNLTREQWATRRNLPQRRASVNFDMEFGGIGRSYQITVGFYSDGCIGEVFVNGGKSGQDAEAIARDGAILLSLALQYGAQLSNIKSAITRDEQGEPSSIIGAVVDQLTREVSRMSTITEHDKLRCVERELSFRRRVYARRVEQGKMKEAEADRELAVMECIRQDYHRSAQLCEPQLFPNDAT